MKEKSPNTCWKKNDEYHRHTTEEKEVDANCICKMQTIYMMSQNKQK